MRIWRYYLMTREAVEAGLGTARVFDGAGVAPSSELDLAMTDWVSACIEEGCRNFVAAGGDGTVHKLINILMRIRQSTPVASACKLGAVALGSSNDFHKPLQKEGKGIVHSRLNFSSAFPHDLGEVRFGNEIRYFAINSSIGITAQANLFFNQAGGRFQALKRISPDLAIVAAAIREWFLYRSFPIRLKGDLDGEECLKELDLVNLGVTKNPHFAGSFRYDSPQKVDDGDLRVHLYQGTGRGAGQLSDQLSEKVGILRTLLSLSRGRFTGRPGASSHKATEVILNSDRSFALETDGEVFLTQEARFKVLPREILLCPATYLASRF